jgi:hypothetical protein
MAERHTGPTAKRHQESPLGLGTSRHCESQVTVSSPPLEDSSNNIKNSIPETKSDHTIG